VLQENKRNFRMLQEDIGLSMISKNFLGVARIQEQTQVRAAIIQKLLEYSRNFLENNLRISANFQTVLGGCNNFQEYSVRMY
jgi:hypothetical protein